MICGIQELYLRYEESPLKVRTWSSDHVALNFFLMTDIFDSDIQRDHNKCNPVILTIQGTWDWELRLSIVIRQGELTSKHYDTR